MYDNESDAIQVQCRTGRLGFCAFVVADQQRSAGEALFEVKLPSMMIRSVMMSDHEIHQSP
jgi:hypothetical protein